MRPEPSHATARRAELFDQLTALFLAEGFAHLTLDELTRRLRCSKSTLYTLADGRDSLVRAVVVHFFKGATAFVDGRAKAGGNRITAYLEAVGEALEPASERFMADLAAFPPAREVYERNTAIAARKVRDLVDEGVAAGEYRAVNADFVADVVASTMVRIQQRRVAEATGLDDARAYRELATLVTAGVTGAVKR